MCVINAYVCALNSCRCVVNVYLCAAAIWSHKHRFKEPRPSVIAVLWVLLKSSVFTPKNGPGRLRVCIIPPLLIHTKKGAAFFFFFKRCFFQASDFWAGTFELIFSTQEKTFCPKNGLLNSGTAFLPPKEPFCVKNNLFGPRTAFLSQNSIFIPRKAFLREILHSLFTTPPQGAFLQIPPFSTSQPFSFYIFPDPHFFPFLIILSQGGFLKQA